MIPYNPLAGGFLSGKHRPEGRSEGTRFALENGGRLYRERYWHEREFATVEALRRLAAEAGIPLVRLAVAWVLAHPAITAPINGHEDRVHRSRHDGASHGVAVVDQLRDRARADGFDIVRLIADGLEEQEERAGVDIRVPDVAIRQVLDLDAS